MIMTKEIEPAHNMFFFADFERLADDDAEILIAFLNFQNMTYSIFDSLP